MLEEVRDFGEEIAKIMPLLLREVTSKKATIFTSGEITVAHIAIIEYLSEKGASSMGDIAKILNLSVSAATSVIDKMIDMKFVHRKRSDKDRRVVLVALDKKGQETAKKTMQGRKNAFNDLFSCLEDNEKVEYLRLLTKIHDYIRNRDEEK